MCECVCESLCVCACVVCVFDGEQKDTCCLKNKERKGESYKQITKETRGKRDKKTRVEEVDRKKKMLSEKNWMDICAISLKTQRKRGKGEKV